jgi:pyruvate/2-oxoglutarate/acetoin dehydrogenase E1 component
VPEVDYWILPIGKAKVRREGTDVTITSHSRMVGFALKAAEELAKEGISAEVVDLRTLRPLDHETIVESVKKTNRIVSVEEGWGPMGVGAEICGAGDRARLRLSGRAAAAGYTRRTCRCPMPPIWKPCRFRPLRRSSQL